MGGGGGARGGGGGGAQARLRAKTDGIAVQCLSCLRPVPEQFPRVGEARFSTLHSPALKQAVNGSVNGGMFAEVCVRVYLFFWGGPFP